MLGLYLASCPDICDFDVIQLCCLMHKESRVVMEGKCEFGVLDVNLIFDMTCVERAVRLWDPIDRTFPNVGTARE